MFRKLLLVTLVLFVACPQIALGQQAGRLNPETAPRQKDTTSTVSDGQLYRNEEHHFRIKFPAGWEIEDGDGEHVVKKAVKDGNTVLILVRDFLDFLSEEEKTSLSKKERLELSSAEFNDFTNEEADVFLETLATGQLESFPGSTVLEKDIRYIDNRKAAYLKMNQVYKVQDRQVEGTFVNYFTLHKGKLYQIGGLYSKNELDQESTINASLATFVFEDWDDTGNKKDQPSINATNELAGDLFGGNLSGREIFVAIITSILFTWMLGLAVPLLLRFVFLKRPLSKGLSLLVVSVVFIIQVLASMVITNGGRISLSLYLIAYIGYLILRKELKDNGVRYCRECGGQTDTSTMICKKCGKSN